MKKLVAFGFAFVLATTGFARADEASDTAAKINALQQQLDVVKAQLDALQKAQAAQAAAKASPAPGVAPKAPTSVIGVDTSNNAVTLLIGGERIQLYGNLDVSYDVTTKGLAPRYPDPNNPGSFQTPEGVVGWQSAISTNLSYIGVRGNHKIGNKTGLVYQLETQIDVSSSSGFANTNSNNSAIVKGGLTSRNSFIGIQTPGAGTFRIGKTDAPYKQSTARMNPFSAEIGDYSVIMGNSGGDNRVEFGTRLDHAFWWDSPNWGGLTFSGLVSPGQNRANDNSLIGSGEPECTGGNLPGSGATPPACNDGSFGSAYSASLSYQKKNLYITAAYELHRGVNRVSDLGDQNPADVVDEAASKFGIQYALSKFTTFNAIYENMARYVPGFLQNQNERSRNGFWLAATQNLDANNSINLGWARANPTPGDPGQHNTVGGANPDNMANMYTIAYKHTIDRHVSWYLDWAETINHPQAHYDLGAGGRGLTTDCHDGSQLAAFDATTGGVTGSGPHCYAGGRLSGFSTGLNVRF